MGADGLVGEKAEGTLLGWTTLVIDKASLPGGWLYIHVATRTVVDPMTKEGVMRKSKRMTDAKNEIMIDKLVANPFKMLSEYLMTTAVTSPPKT